MNYIQINVEFYDNVERDLLKKNFPKEFSSLSNLTRCNILVPFAEFKTYTQFQNQNPSRPGFQDFERIQKKSDDLFGPIDVYTKYDANTEKFNSEFEDSNENNYVTESLGVGGILSVLSYAYGLTQADWKRIDIQSHKDLDFDSSVIENFSKLLVVEAKGSIVKDNTKKTSKISKHKKKIKDKKNDKNVISKYKVGADLLIGGITIADPKNHLKVLLVDPPIENQLNDNYRKKIKVIKRTSFYLDWLRVISERSYISLVLSNRLRVLEKLDDVNVLDGVELTNSKNEPLKITDQFIDEHSNIEKKIIGKFEILTRRKGIFIGLPEEVYNIIASQEQNRLVKYKHEPSYSNKSIDLIISKKQINDNQEFFFNAQITAEDVKKDFVKVKAENVKVTESSSGFSFAIIGPNNIELNE